MQAKVPTYVFSGKELISWQKAVVDRVRGDRTVGRGVDRENPAAARCRRKMLLVSRARQTVILTQTPRKVVLMSVLSLQQIERKTSNIRRPTSNIGQEATISSGCFLIIR